jgi:HEAT repeat protein
LKDPAVAPALIEALKEDDAFVLTAILRALKQLRIKDARPHAIELLQHSHPGVRREAVGVLGYLQDVENLPQLMSVASNDADPEVRRAAVGTLIFAPAGMVAESLMKAISDENWLVRVESIKGLGKLKVQESLPLLMAAVDDERWQVQEKGAEAIGLLGAYKGIPALAKCIVDPISNLRKSAVAALGQIKHVDGLPLLEIAKEDNDPDVRKLARWACDQIAEASEVEA